MVVVSGALAYVFEAHGSHPFILTGRFEELGSWVEIMVWIFAGFVKPGLPSISPPPFSTQVGNTTYSFIDMTSTMGTAILVVPLLSILENIALAKVFCKSSFTQIHKHRNMLLFLH